MTDRPADHSIEHGEKRRSTDVRHAGSAELRRNREFAHNPGDAVSSVSRMLIPTDEGGQKAEAMVFDLLVRTLYHHALFYRDRKAQADLLSMRRSYQRMNPRNDPFDDLVVVSESQEEMDEPQAYEIVDSNGEAPNEQSQCKITDEGRQETFDRISSKRIPITDGDNVRRVTMERALWIVLYADTIGGDAKARKLLLRFMDVIDKSGVQPKPDYIDEDGNWEFTLNIGDKQVIEG